MNEIELRSYVVGIANEWLKAGFKESDGSHMNIINIYNKHTPLARNYKVKKTDAWCATTVSALFIEAENRTGIKFTSIMGLECSCENQINLLKKLSSWQERDDYTPTIGDTIYYDWQDNGKGDNTGHADHVGIVAGISGTTITVIEGNNADAVKTRKIKVNGKTIRGFGVPKYSKLVTGTTTTASKPATTNTTVAKPAASKPATTTTTAKPATTTTVAKPATTTTTVNVKPVLGKYVNSNIDYGYVFDPVYYSNKYGDLKKAFGTNAKALFNHFLNHGMNEHRQAIANFNVEVYKAKNKDLQRAFGGTWKKYYQHYCRFGYKEKRVSC